MTEANFKTAVELDRRAIRLRQSVVNLHDIAEGRPSRVDPLQQESASKETAVRYAIASERVPLSATVWEQIYSLIEADLHNQVKAIDDEFVAL